MSDNDYPSEYISDKDEPERDWLPGPSDEQETPEPVDDSIYNLVIQKNGGEKVVHPNVDKTLLGFVSFNQVQGTEPKLLVFRNKDDEVLVVHVDNIDTIRVEKATEPVFRPNIVLNDRRKDAVPFTFHGSPTEMRNFAMWLVKQGDARDLSNRELRGPYNFAQELARALMYQIGPDTPEPEGWPLSVRGRLLGDPEDKVRTFQKISCEGRYSYYNEYINWTDGYNSVTWNNLITEQEN